jgi:hypothetical protein
VAPDTACPTKDETPALLRIFAVTKTMALGPVVTVTAGPVVDKSVNEALVVVSRVSTVAPEIVRAAIELTPVATKI